MDDAVSVIKGIAVSSRPDHVVWGTWGTVDAGCWRAVDERGYSGSGSWCCPESWGMRGTEVRWRVPRAHEGRIFLISEAERNVLGAVVHLGFFVYLIQGRFVCGDAVEIGRRLEICGRQHSILSILSPQISCQPHVSSGNVIPVLRNSTATVKPSRTSHVCPRSGSGPIGLYL